MAFVERGRPTLIQEEGADRFSRGTIWVAEADGAVVRTRLELQIPLRQTTMAVEVDYRRDAKLDLWVPARMHEIYQRSFESIVLERIDCVANYSNFRRFETSGRMIVPE